MNPNCNLKEKLIYMIGDVKLYVCDCGYELAENPNNKSLTSHEQMLFQQALEDYYKSKK